ncbi:MAG: cytidine deaminase [Candidatus Woesearchaeota archaeon]|jgi:cytidine deaminase
MKITNKELIERAKSISCAKNLNSRVRVASVGCALISKKGNIYIGINVHTDCDLGFCAEHSAIANMILNEEYVIKKIVAVHGEKIYPPCGRCRELMYQLSSENKNTKIIVSDNKTMTLKELLPDPWEDLAIKKEKNR